MPAFTTALLVITNIVHLTVTQVFLRRMQVALPIDLTAWTLVLALQFGLAIIVTALLPRLERALAPWPLLLALLAAKLAGLLAAAVFPPASLMAAVCYFAAANAELALFFRYAEDKNLARTNLFIYTGAALGLYLSEKVFFRIVPLSSLLIAAAIMQLLTAYLWHEKLKQRNLDFNNDRDFEDESSLAPTATRWLIDSAKLKSAAAGFFLFSGLLLAHRLLRLYLTDSADIIAEITVFSMLAAVAASYAFPKLVRLPIAGLSILQGVGGALFLLLLLHLDSLLNLVRELLFFLTLAPLILFTTTTYLQSLNEEPRRSHIPVVMAFNLLGSLAAALVFGYVAIPRWGIESAIWLFFALWLVWQASQVWQLKLKASLTQVAFLSSIGLCALVVFLSLRTAWLSRQLNAMLARVAPGESIVAQAETPQDFWLLTEKPAGNRPTAHRLIRTSHSMSGSMYPSRRYMKLMAYLGALYARDLTQALNIGYGTGLTAQALTELPLRKIDVSDITDRIVPLASLLHSREGQSDPISDRRVSYHLGGARHFLQTSTEKYDIVTGEPPPPSNSSIAYLYTREFYTLVKEHLAAGGVFTYWLPTHSVADGSSAIIWDTFCEVFIYCDLFAGTESNLIMVGYTSKEQITLAERLELLEKTRIREDTGLAAADVLSLIVQTRARSENPSKPGHILTDDLAYIEEDFPTAKKHFWGLSGLPFREQQHYVEVLLARRFSGASNLTQLLRPILIYSADIAYDPYRALKSLEILAEKNVSLPIALWLLGIDPGGKQATFDAGEKFRSELARLLTEKKIHEASRLVSQWFSMHRDDEYAFALKILMERLLKKDQNSIRRSANDFMAGRPVSESFARYAGF
jgi:spermidine synthase